MAPSVSMISSLWMNLLHLAIIWAILGGQISFILLARSRQVSATFSQFSSLMGRWGGARRLRIAMARYWVSLWTFLWKERTHLIARRRYSSSMDSMEWVDELVDSEKAGIEVHLCSNRAEWQLLRFWNFCCMLSLNSNIEDITQGTIFIHYSPSLHPTQLAHLFQQLLAHPVLPLHLFRG